MPFGVLGRSYLIIFLIYKAKHQHINTTSNKIPAAATSAWKQQKPFLIRCRHLHTYVSVLQRTHIIGAIATHQCHITQFLQRRYNKLFLLGSDPCMNSDSWQDLVEEFLLCCHQEVQSLQTINDFQILSAESPNYEIIPFTGLYNYKTSISE